MSTCGHERDLRDGQQARLKGAPQILFEPFFQRGPPLARLAEFDALPDFSEGQHACEKETILRLGQPALDAGIGLTAPGELRLGHWCPAACPATISWR